MYMCIIKTKPLKVSCTVTFDPETEATHIPAALAHFQYMLKGISFLPRVTNKQLRAGDDETLIDVKHPYPQMPYERITKSQYETKMKSLKPFSLRGMRGVLDREMPDLFCENDRCDIPVK
jgi:ribonucleoside-triphosphate reductase (thioredoxin)